MTLTSLHKCVEQILANPNWKALIGPVKIQETATNPIVYDGFHFLINSGVGQGGVSPSMDGDQDIGGSTSSFKSVLLGPFWSTLFDFDLNITNYEVRNRNSEHSSDGNNNSVDTSSFLADEERYKNSACKKKFCIPIVIVFFCVDSKIIFVYFLYIFLFYFLI